MCYYPKKSHRIIGKFNARSGKFPGGRIDRRITCHYVSGRYAIGYSWRSGWNGNIYTYI